MTKAALVASALVLLVGFAALVPTGVDVLQENARNNLCEACLGCGE